MKKQQTFTIQVVKQEATSSKLQETARYVDHQEAGRAVRKRGDGSQAEERERKEGDGRREPAVHEGLPSP